MEACGIAGITKIVAFAQMLLRKGYFFRYDVLLQRGTGDLFKTAADIGAVMMKLLCEYFYGQIVIRQMPVSYTHLTLPTTPYV